MKATTPMRLSSWDCVTSKRVSRTLYYRVFSGVHAELLYNVAFGTTLRFHDKFDESLRFLAPDV